MEHEDAVRAARRARDRRHSLDAHLDPAEPRKILGRDRLVEPRAPRAALDDFPSHAETRRGVRACLATVGNRGGRVRLGTACDRAEQRRRDGAERQSRTERALAPPVAAQLRTHVKSLWVLGSSALTCAPVTTHISPVTTSFRNVSTLLPVFSTSHSHWICSPGSTRRSPETSAPVCLATASDA